MKRYRMKFGPGFLLCLSLMLGILISCNKGFDRIVEQREYNDTTSAVAKSPHVLYIIVDGARGTAVRDAKPPHIMALTTHAIYCWNSVTDTLTKDKTTWADLLTAVHKDKHEVLGNGPADNNLKNYPIFFKYVKDRDSDFRILSFSSSDSLGRMIAYADVNKSFNNNDAATQEAALNAVKTDSATLMLVQYNSVDSAGTQYGYGLSVPEYKNAILNVDSYIGQLIAALKSRKSYKNESWMIVVTSNHGGPFKIPATEDDHTILSNPRVNSFIIFSNPSFSPSFIDKPYTGNRYIGKSVEFQGADAAAVYATVPDDDGDYNFGATVEFTIEMKIKITRGDDGEYHNISDYPSLFSKRNSFNRDVTGWTFYLHDKHWAFLAEQVGGFTEAVGPDILDGTWHDIAVVVENRDNKRYARIYTDGNYNKEADITGRGNLNSDAPLTLGYLAGIGAGHLDNVYVSDLKIWRAALDDETIGQYACEPGLADDHPFNDKLIGYWPSLDGSGNVIKDHGTLQHDFILGGPFRWDDFNDLVCPPPASNLAKQMPQPVDVATQILNWLRVPVNPRWSLDGRVWTTEYEDVKE